MEIAVYGAGKVASRFVEAIKKSDMDIHVVYFIQTKKDCDSFCGSPVVSVGEISWNDFEKLVIASTRYYDEMLESVGYKSLSQACKNRVQKSSDFLSAVLPKDEPTVVEPYTVVKVDEGLCYIGDSTDKFLIKDMQNTRHTNSKKMIDDFFELTKKYYKQSTDSKSRKKYFLDIGANIGTTSIYVKKCINPELNIIGFEASKRNYDVFRVNCILNGVDDIKCEGFGLYNEAKQVRFHFVSENPGGSGINGQNLDSLGKDEFAISVIPLDKYLGDNNINPEDIDYIWMDVENSEPEVLSGAGGALKRKKIPLLHEFSVRNYYDTGRLEMYLNIVQSVYDGFIDMRDPNLAAHQINELRDFSIKMVNDGKIATDLFFY